MIRLLALASCCVTAWGILAPEAGAITKKKLIKPVTEKPAEGTKADFEADRVTYDPRTKTAVATGTVRIVYGPYVLLATKVTYNQAKDTFEANGSVQLREPNGNILLARDIFLKNKFKDGFARHLQALLNNNVSIKAQYAERQNGEVTIYEKARYTACTGCETRNGDPLWELVTEKTVHDEVGKTLYHTSPRLRIGGVTVAGLPYFAMPDPTVRRRTGFLQPSIRSGDQYGLALVTPYFWDIAPNMDLTFSPMWSFKQGPVADVEWRHRLQSGTYNIRGYGVYQLNRSTSTIYDDEHFRGAVKTSGRFNISDDWKWGWNGVKASDKTFLRRYDFDKRFIGTNEIYATGLWDETFVDVRAMSFVPLTASEDWDVQPTALPYITGSHVFADPVLGGELTANWSTYSIRRDKPHEPYVNVDHATSQSRAVLDMRWKKQLFTSLGHVVTPFARVRGDVYVTNNLPDDTAPGGMLGQETVARVLPAAGVDMRWPLIAPQFGGQGIVSPVFQFIAASDETDRDKIGNEDAISVSFDHSSLFLDDRFTGMDRYEGGTRINAGLTYSWFGDNGGSIRGSMGESFHIAGDNSFGFGSGLEGSKSDLVAAISAQPVDWLNLSYETRLEEDLSDFNRHEAYLGLTFDRFSGHAGYEFIAAEPEYGRQKAEEFAFAGGRFMLTDGWYAFGNASYELQDGFLRSGALGIEFDCDCMNAKFTYSQSKESVTAERDHRISVSLELVTLGGTAVSSKF